MALELFIQGPMTQAEAAELTQKYRLSGKRALITESFHPGFKMVQVYLPVFKRTPRPSSTYQQRIWK